MKRYYLALDLNEDPLLIKEYESWHLNVWPEIQKSIVDSGILSMEIYRTGNRLFMMMEVDDVFSFERKYIMDASNAMVQEWEEIMWQFQKPLPWAQKGEKWILMKRIFHLEAKDVNNVV